MNDQMTSNKRKKAGRERGQSTTEFVLIFPLLILLFFFMLDFGWMLKNWIVVTNAAREATRCAAADACLDDGGGEASPATVACNRIAAGIPSNLENRSVQVAYDDPGGDGVKSGDAIILTVTAKNTWITPLLAFVDMIDAVSGKSTGLGTGLDLKARETMRLEVGEPFGGTVGTTTCT